MPSSKKKKTKDIKVFHAPGRPESPESPDAGIKSSAAFVSQKHAGGGSKKSRNGSSSSKVTKKISSKSTSSSRKVAKIASLPEAQLSGSSEGGYIDGPGGEQSTACGSCGGWLSPSDFQPHSGQATLMFLYREAFLSITYQNFGFVKSATTATSGVPSLISNILWNTIKPIRLNGRKDLRRFRVPTRGFFLSYPEYQQVLTAVLPEISNSLFAASDRELATDTKRFDANTVIGGMAELSRRDLKHFYLGCEYQSVCNWGCVDDEFWTFDSAMTVSELFNHPLFRIAFEVYLVDGRNLVGIPQLEEFKALTEMTLKEAIDAPFPADIVGEPTPYRCFLWFAFQQLLAAVNNAQTCDMFYRFPAPFLLGAAVWYVLRFIATTYHALNIPDMLTTPIDTPAMYNAMANVVLFICSVFNANQVGGYEFCENPCPDPPAPNPCNPGCDDVKINCDFLQPPNSDCVNGSMASEAQDLPCECTRVVEVDDCCESEEECCEDECEPCSPSGKCVQCPKNCKPNCIPDVLSILNDFQRLNYPTDDELAQLQQAAQLEAEAQFQQQQQQQQPQLQSVPVSAPSSDPSDIDWSSVGVVSTSKGVSDTEPEKKTFDGSLDVKESSPPGTRSFGDLTTPLQASEPATTAPATRSLPSDPTGAGEGSGSAGGGGSELAHLSQGIGGMLSRIDAKLSGPNAFEKFSEDYIRSSEERGETPASLLLLALWYQFFSAVKPTGLITHTVGFVYPAFMESLTYSAANILTSTLNGEVHLNHSQTKVRFSEWTKMLDVMATVIQPSTFVSNTIDTVGGLRFDYHAMLQGWERLAFNDLKAHYLNKRYEGFKPCNLRFLPECNWPYDSSTLMGTILNNPLAQIYLIPYDIDGNAFEGIPGLLDFATNPDVQATTIRDFLNAPPFYPDSPWLTLLQWAMTEWIAGYTNSRSQCYWYRFPTLTIMTSLSYAVLKTLGEAVFSLNFTGFPFPPADTGTLSKALLGFLIFTFSIAQANRNGIHGVDKLKEHSGCCGSSSCSCQPAYIKSINLPNIMDAFYDFMAT